jgi:hypothetical protein
MMAPLSSLKVIPAGPDDIPDGPYSQLDRAGTYLKLPREAKSDN